MSGRAYTYPIRILRGYGWKRLFFCHGGDVARTPISLAGATIKLWARSRDGALLQELASGGGQITITDAPGGRFTVEWTAAQAEALAAVVGSYELEVVLASTEPALWVQGAFEVLDTRKAVAP